MKTIACRTHFWCHCQRLALGLALACGLAGHAIARTAAPPTAYLQKAVVSRVVDGDTVWLKPLGQTGDHRLFKVRILGIDAPELCQSGGGAARDALAQRLARQTVSLAMPPARSYDDYGRALAKIYLDGEDIGRWMVSRGHAWSYALRGRDGPYDTEQAGAKTAARGIFASPLAENPRSFRKRHGPCPR